MACPAALGRRGGTFATATADTAATAQIDAGATTSATRNGNLAISAIGIDSDTATSFAGSGGVVSGATASSVTGNSSGQSSTALAQLLDDGLTKTRTPNIVAGNFSVTAEQRTTFLGNTDATQGTFAGGTGTHTDNAINSSATALVGRSDPTQTATLAISAPNILIAAVDRVFEPANGIDANVGAGGAIQGSSGHSTSTVTQNTAVTVGDGVKLTVTGDFLAGAGVLAIEAASVLNTVDLVKFSTGAGLAIASADSKLTANLTNTVTIGQGAALKSAGAIEIGSFIVANTNNTLGRGDLWPRRRGRRYGVGQRHRNPDCRYRRERNPDRARYDQRRRRAERRWRIRQFLYGGRRQRGLQQCPDHRLDKPDRHGNDRQQQHLDRRGGGAAQQRHQHRARRLRRCRDSHRHRQRHRPDFRGGAEHQ